MSTEPIKTNNPASGKPNLPKDWRPFSGGQTKLDTVHIEGYHLRWFRGDPGRIERALKAGYTFVNKEDTDVVNTDIAGGGDTEKGTDMGSRISIVSGDEVSHDGQPGRMYLMKCPLEIYRYARSLHDAQLDATVDALKGKMPGNVREGGETVQDSRQRYVKELKAPLLTKKSPST